MNKNTESYKNTYSQLRPSAEAVERVMDMTGEKRIRFKPVVQRLVAAAIALAIVVGGGLGINLLPKKSEYNDELGVIVAYAYNDDYYKVDYNSKLEMFCALYVVPENDKVKADEVMNRWDHDYDEYNKRLYEAGYGYSKGTNGRGCLNSAGQPTAMLYIIHTGGFVLDIDDYSEIKTLKVENTGKYGELRSEYDFEGSREIEISGDMLRKSQNGPYAELANGEYIITKSSAIKWWPSEELGKAIGNNLNFDLANVKDTIRFTVEFNDGTVKTGSIDLYFDSNGYMHFGK